MSLERAHYWFKTRRENCFLEKLFPLRFWKTLSYLIWSHLSCASLRYACLIYSFQSNIECTPRRRCQRQKFSNKWGVIVITISVFFFVKTVWLSESHHCGDTWWENGRFPVLLHEFTHRRASLVHHSSCVYKFRICAGSQSIFNK